MRRGEAGFRVREASGSPTYLLRPRATHRTQITRIMKLWLRKTGGFPFGAK